jgi:hypothetical protein
MRAAARAAVVIVAVIGAPAFAAAQPGPLNAEPPGANRSGPVEQPVAPDEFVARVEPGLPPPAPALRPSRAATNERPLWPWLAAVASVGAGAGAALARRTARRTRAMR